MVLNYLALHKLNNGRKVKKADINMCRNSKMYSAYSTVAEEVTFLLPDVRGLEPSLLPGRSCSPLYNRKVLY